MFSVFGFFSIMVSSKFKKNNFLGGVTLAVKLRLKRTGTTNSACWRVVAADSKSPRDGKNIEELGFYNPTKEPAELKMNEERVKYWLSVGAQPSEQVASLIKQAGIK